MQKGNPEILRLMNKYTDDFRSVNKKVDIARKQWQELDLPCNTYFRPLGPGTSRFWSWIDRFDPLIPYLAFNSATDRVTFLGKNPKKD